MKALVGIFRETRTADAALQELQGSGFSPDQFILLTPGTVPPNTFTEATLVCHPPGACGANTGQVGGAITGFASGILGGALVSLLIPGAGPLMAIGTLALSGSFGAVAGGIVGHAIQVADDPPLLPEEQFVCEEALRQGAHVLIIQPSDDEHERLARTILTKHEAETVAQARERWWQQLRVNEERIYTNASEPFSVVESRYRQGFEAALDVRLRGKTDEEKEAVLTQHYAAIAQDAVFRHGFTRGAQYYEAVIGLGDPRRATAFAAIEADAGNT